MHMAELALWLRDEKNISGYKISYKCAYRKLDNHCWVFTLTKMSNHWFHKDTHKDTCVLTWVS